MNISYYVMDVFTDKQFHGNPAAVCLLDQEISTEAQQNIAAEINLSETAFVLKTEAGLSLRWFTPKVEIDLCGHATLATAYALYEAKKTKEEVLDFSTLSGILSVRKEQDTYWLTLPKREVSPIEHFKTFNEAFSTEAFNSYKAADFMLVFPSAEEIKKLRPDFSILKKIKKEAALDNDVFGIIVTAPGDGDCDFVSRFFAPNAGLNEDPVTGRAHCSTVPFWAEELNKDRLRAKQLSTRGGTIECRNHNDNVELGAKIQLFSEGTIRIQT